MRKAITSAKSCASSLSPKFRGIRQTTSSAVKNSHGKTIDSRRYSSAEYPSLVVPALAAMPKNDGPVRRTPSASEWQPAQPRPSLYNCSPVAASPAGRGVVKSVPTGSNSPGVSVVVGAAWVVVGGCVVTAVAVDALVVDPVPPPQAAATSPNAPTTATNLNNEVRFIEFPLPPVATYHRQTLLQKATIHFRGRCDPSCVAAPSPSGRDRKLKRDSSSGEVLTGVLRGHVPTWRVRASEARRRRPMLPSAGLA